MNFLLQIFLICSTILKLAELGEAVDTKNGTTTKSMKFAYGKLFVSTSNTNKEEVAPGVEAFTISQKLDHFNPSAGRRWNQVSEILKNFSILKCVTKCK